MRLAPLVLVLLAVRASGAERPFDYPVATPDAHFDAVFTKTTYEESKSEGTKLAIKDREQKVVFEREITRDVACNAQWTQDCRFLVVTALDGGGHQPWHYHVYVFSLESRELRQLDDPEGTPFVSCEIFMQPPHTVILIGHTFEHGFSAPQEPVRSREAASIAGPKFHSTLSDA
jgi:hypothetical protein